MIEVDYKIKRYLSVDGLYKYGEVNEKIDYLRKSIAKKLGRPYDEVSVFDAVKFIHAKKIKNIKDLHELSGEYYSMALLLNEIGLPHTEYLKEANKYELLRYKKDGDIVKKVEILADADSSCEYCKKNHGLILTIDEALEEMPIPNKKCSHMVYENAAPFCRCCYVAHIEY